MGFRTNARFAGQEILDVFLCISRTFFHSSLVNPPLQFILPVRSSLQTLESIIKPNNVYNYPQRILLQPSSRSVPNVKSGNIRHLVISSGYNHLQRVHHIHVLKAGNLLRNYILYASFL